MIRFKNFTCDKEIEENHLLNVHVDVSHGLIVVEAHHGGFDSDGWLTVGRRRRHSSVVITSQAALQTQGWRAATSAADSLGVRAERVEAVLTRAGFPHVFSKVTAG